MYHKTDYYINATMSIKSDPLDPVGLFTARWVLMSLGQVDYGLFGVVGGMADGRIAAKIW